MNSKIIIRDMIRAVKNETAYFPKFFDTFYLLPPSHKDGLINFILSKVSKERWEKLAAEGEYRGIIRGLLMEYSGRQELQDPSRIDLAKLVGEYVRSIQFKEAEDLVGLANVKEELEAI